MTDAEREHVLDEEHLRLLRLGYLITGIVSAVFSLFPLIYVAMGILFATSSFPRQAMKPGQPDMSVFGWVMAAFGGMFCLFLVVSAALKLFAAKSIRERRRLGVCKAAAAVSCLGIPYGTVLGVLSFQVLGRPSVAALFASPGYPQAPPPMPLPTPQI